MSRDFSKTDTPHNRHNVYAGEFAIAPRAPQIRVPDSLSPALSMAAEGMQKVNQNLADFENEAAERAEYQLDTSSQLQIAALQNSINADCTRRMNLHDGHPDSFYDKHGAFRDSFYQDWKARSSAAFDTLPQGYIRQSSQMKAKASAELIKSKLLTGIDARMAENLAPRARKSALALAEFQADQGDFVSSRATILGMPGYAISDIERQAALLDIDRKSIVYNVTSAVATGDTETYLSLVQDAELMKKLTPEQRLKVYNYQRSLPMSSTFEDLEVPLDSSHNSPGSPAKSSGKKEGPGLPMGVSDELVRLHDQWNIAGDPDAKSNPIMQQQALKALDRYGARLITHKATEEDREHFRLACAGFGIGSGMANAIIEKYEKALKPTKAFDLDKSIKALRPVHFSSYDIRHQLADARKRYAEYAAAGDHDAMKLLKGEMENMNANARAFSDELESRILQRYSDWNDSIADPDSITDADRNITLMNILDEEKEKLIGEFNLDFTQADNFDYTQTYLDASKEASRVKEAREAALKRREELDKESIEVDKRRISAQAEKERDEAYAQTASQPQQGFTYASTPISITPPTQLEDNLSASYIAVPKGDQLAGKKVSFKHGGRTHTFECREAKVDSPTFTAKALASLQMLGSSESFTLAYNSEGKAVLTNTTVPQRDYNMYRVFMNVEARRDSHGNLSVYKLLKADGGGEYEVAGINVKDHPEEAAQLKRMIESGASNEEVERAVMQHYQTITQDGKDMIAPATNSRGIELFMRDCTLNHGAGGAASILRKAVGVGEKEPVTTATKNFIARYGEAALLDALVKTRRNRYIAIANKNPEKAIFINGWLNNRLPTISRAAYATLRQRSE